ncbi:MAG: hypothetical protein HQM11_15865 [SAR324 cluster bacterium]|nr:hypothetical protein [SAR324 cluster bacterium]
MATKQSIKFRVKYLGSDNIDSPWLAPSTKEYKHWVVVVQKQMGADYQKMSKLISLVLNHVEEQKQIRRILPKSEWTLACQIEVVTQQSHKHYLLIVGADVVTKSKSMAYGAGTDAYDYSNQFFVVGARELLQESRFGAPVKTRLVNGNTFHEFDARQPAVYALGLKLIRMLMTQENIQSDDEQLLSE